MRAITCPKGGESVADKSQKKDGNMAGRKLALTLWKRDSEARRRLPNSAIQWELRGKSKEEWRKKKSTYMEGARKVVKARTASSAEGQGDMIHEGCLVIGAKHWTTRQSVL